MKRLWRNLSHSRLTMCVLLGLVLIIVVLLAAPRTAQAVAFDDDGFIAADEVIHDDLFISAESVVMNGVINGALFASGENVTINGDINGDLIATGNTVIVNGVVNGNVAFAGFKLQMNNAVGGSIFFLGNSLVMGPGVIVRRNIFFNGFNLDAQAGSQVQRDANISGYQALLNGQIDHNVNGDLGALEIGGRIGGDVRVKVPEPAPFDFQYWPGVSQVIDAGLRVTESALIEGALTYVSPVEQADAIQSRPGGGVIYQPSTVETSKVMQASKGFVGWILDRIQRIVTLLILGGLLIWRWPNLLGQLSHYARTRPLPAVGLGAVAFLTGGVGGVLLTMSIFILGLLLGVVALSNLAGVTFSLGISGMLFLGALAIFLLAHGSKIVVSQLLGDLILTRLAPQYEQKPMWSLTLGVIVYVLLRSIPLLGLLIGAIATLVGLGAMWMWFWKRAKRCTVSAGVADTTRSTGRL